ncbi:MAG: polymerase, sigma 54 subunit, RpoN [Thermomicrobiales bacterium]|nr:polymerase, sigma 54 subunit, RpoN [Thermomicrobiales bacterium]
MASDQGSRNLWSNQRGDERIPMQSMNTHMEQHAEMQQTFSPLLMQANHILSLSQSELEAAINEAIDENPALELEDVAACPVCGRRTSGEACASCRSLPPEPPTIARSDDAPTRVDVEYRAPSTADPDFDPMSVIANATDVREQILESALASLDNEVDQAMALILVDAIDERGFLALSLDDIAAETGADLGDVERVLAVVQEVAPPGVGARSLQESLRLQVDYLRAEGVTVPAVVAAVIDGYLEELGSKRIPRIARALDVDPMEIEAAQDFIRDQLTPHPLQSHQSPTWTAPSSGGHVVPDVVITMEGDQLWIEVPNAIYDRLHTEAFYRAIAKPDANGTNPTPDATAIDQDAITHAKTQVARAQQFIWAVRQRKQTLLRVAEYVCSYQEAYIRGDARGLRPLTRSEVANALGVHESTCSRAVAGKFVMLPSRKVIPMSDLFAASLSIKYVIQQIITDEAATGATLSDAQISERLLDHGIRIARRTVAKYRSQMHILPSTIR